MSTLKIEINPGKYAGISGTSHQLVIEPEDRRVYVFSHVGAGCPASVHHGRARSFDLPSAFLGEDLREIVTGAQSEIEALIDAYAGSTWDGANWRGSWSAAEEGAFDALRVRFDGVRDYLTDGELVDWYSSALTSDDVVRGYPAAVAGDLEGLIRAIGDELKGCHDYPRASEEAIREAAEWMIGEAAGEVE